MRSDNLKWTRRSMRLSAIIRGSGSISGVEHIDRNLVNDKFAIVKVKYKSTTDK